VSRGYGAVQRFILEELEDRAEREGSPGVAFEPVGTIAGRYASKRGVPNNASLHRSFRRAAYGLFEAGEVCLQREFVPTRRDIDWEPVPGSWREVMCVGLPCGRYSVEPILRAAILFGVGPDSG